MSREQPGGFGFQVRRGRVSLSERPVKRALCFGLGRLGETGAVGRAEPLSLAADLEQVAAGRMPQEHQADVQVGDGLAVIRLELGDAEPPGLIIEPDPGPVSHGRAARFRSCR
jgi:hypothetical protein